MRSSTFRFVVGILWSVGLWPWRAGSCAYRCWTTVCTLTMVLMLSLQMVKLYLSSGELRYFVETLCVVVTMSNVVFKGAHILSSGRKIRDLVERATDEISPECRSLCGRILSLSHDRIRMLGFTFLGSSLATTAVWVLSPIVIGIYEPDTPWSLPLASFYPYDIHSSATVYWSTYAFETFFCVVMVGWYNSTTLLYIFLVIGACSRFETVSELLRRAGETAQDMSKIEEAEKYPLYLIRNEYRNTAYKKHISGNMDGTVSSDITTSEQTIEANIKNRVEGNLNKIWLDYINYHEIAFRYVKELKNEFSLIVLSEVLMCLANICQTCFLIVVKNGDTANFLKYFGYLVVIMFELLLYCWYGNEIIYQSSAVQWAAYESPWASASPQFQVAMRMVVARSNKKLALTAGSLHTLSLGTFTVILKNSYSLFALLRQINER